MGTHDQPNRRMATATIPQLQEIANVLALETLAIQHLYSRVRFRYFAVQTGCWCSPRLHTNS